MNLTVLRADLDKQKKKASDLLAKTSQAAQAHEEKDAEGKVISTGRLFTPEESAALRAEADATRALIEKITAIESDEQLRAQLSDLTGGVRQTPVPERGPGSFKSLGQQFVESAAGKFFLSGGHRGSRNWQSPVVELFGATLSTGAASGGKLIVSDVQPGIQPLPTKRLTVRDLLAPGTTTSNSITYMKETTFTNAAAAVAEGAAKPESTLIFDQVVDLVTKIAHWLPVTEEMLEDVDQIRSYIDARLRIGVELTEEDQLLNGDGVAPNLLGLMNRPGLSPTVLRGTDTNEDAIFKQMMAIFNASFVMPDAHVINPANWTAIQLSKDQSGQYRGGGPFSAPVAPTLWGLPVAVTPSIVNGIALTGAYGTAAQVFDKGGLRVEASNSHSDFFIKNLVAIRAERRLALAVYRPAAFGKVSGLNT
jgi:HK97 family phage major capsid protein